MAMASVSLRGNGRMEASRGDPAREAPSMSVCRVISQVQSGSRSRWASRTSSCSTHTTRTAHTARTANGTHDTHGTTRHAQHGTARHDTTQHDKAKETRDALEKETDSTDSSWFERWHVAVSVGEVRARVPKDCDVDRLLTDFPNILAMDVPALFEDLRAVLQSTNERLADEVRARGVRLSARERT